MTDTIISVDLGGTRLRSARLDTNLTILKRTETLTKASEGLDAVMQRIKNIIREVWPDDGSNVIGIGISVPGPTNPKTGVVVAPPNLEGWHNVPVVDILNDEFDVPVFIGNDANVAALAEISHGAAKGTRDSIYLTISTGIGSGIISDGKLILGKAGLGGEAGHMIIITEEGRIADLEYEAAGPALGRRARRLIEAGRESLLVEMAKGDLTSIDAKMVGEAANQGDALAIEVVEYAGTIVGYGVLNLLLVFNPEVVVIGGGVSYIGDIFFNKVREAVRKHALDDSYWLDTPIIPSDISEDVSLLGAATLVATEGGRKWLTQLTKRIDLD